MSNLIKMYEQCPECDSYNVDIDVGSGGTTYTCSDCGWVKCVKK